MAPSYPIQSAPPPAIVGSTSDQQTATANGAATGNGAAVSPAATITNETTISNGTAIPPSTANDDDQKIPHVPRLIRALKNGRQGPLKGRNIIVCLDGTGDKFDADNSNIVAFVRCLKKSDPSQVIYYQPGIGTYNGSGLSTGVTAAFDMAIGSGLGVHIRDAYQFLMETYHDNDRIILLGFSRGAYTARCLAGMVHKVGILPAQNVSQIQFAYQYYKDDTPNGWKMSAEFKRTFCMDVSIYFIGVFDSVASVGFIPRRLPLSTTPTNKADYFRHAMALDEHRAKFKVKRYAAKDYDGLKQSQVETHHRTSVMGYAQDSNTLGSSWWAEDADVDPDSVDLFTKLRRQAEAEKQTDVLEVWFAGCHADIGGGAVKNEERHKLSQIPFRWMIRQCFACDTGILFKSHCLAEEGLDVHTLWPAYRDLQKPELEPPPSLMDKYKKGTLGPLIRRATALKPVDPSKPEGLHHVHIQSPGNDESGKTHWTPEQVEDHFDALSPVNDQLEQARGWWVLEAWPIKVRLQPHGQDGWVKKVRMNMGRFRPVQDEAPNLHWTVERKMQVQGYKIRTRMDRAAEWQIVV